MYFFKINLNYNPNNFIFTIYAYYIDYNTTQKNLQSTL